MGLPSPEGNVKRIVLPSGKRIEVVYFPAADGELPPAEGARAEATQRSRPAEPTQAPRKLHICRECDCELVYPIAWEEAGARHWNVTLRCPNCEWRESGTFEQDLVDEFDEQLDRGADTLIGDLKRLTHANMAEEIDRFTVALAADGLLPMDF